MPAQDDLTQAPHFAVPCDDLDASIRFFRDSLGFRLDVIYPADAPRVAVMTRTGMTICLDRSLAATELRLRLPIAGDAPVTAPNGLVIEPVGVLPPARAGLVPEVSVTHDTGDGWVTGRAGMQYRDLVPGRLGGAFIASHIRIPSGGPVPDYIHHHHVRFQAIYCIAGSVRLVYEDQGDPFVMAAGDCVLQPPHIRHRVLECSDGFEVVEVGSPAEHATFVDHELELPNGQDAHRSWHGQQFIFHRAVAAGWQRGVSAGLEVRDTGIEPATGGLASVRVFRVTGAGPIPAAVLDTTVCFRFVLAGTAIASAGGLHDTRVSRGSAIVVPASQPLQLREADSDFSWLEVGLHA